MSAQILLLNPRHKHKKRRRNVRRRARRHNRRAVAPRRRYRARARRHNRRGRYYMRARRRNTGRRRYHARRHNRRYTRRYNRRGMSMPGVGSIRSIVVPALIGAGGAFVVDYAWGYVSGISQVPAYLKSGWGGIAAKAGLALGLGALGFKYAKGQRKFIAYMVGGALTYQAVGVIRSLMSGQPMSGYVDYQAYNLPGTRMAGYMRAQPQLGDLGDWFSPAAVIQPQGTAVPQQFGGYMPRATPMGGYIAAQPHVMGGYDWQNDGM